MEWITDPAIWVSFLTLAFLEIVLGIDNVVFISIVAEKLPPGQRAWARTIGLLLALVMRVVLLFSAVWLIGLTETLFTLFGQEFSWRDLILLGGGLFLLTKGTFEIHETIEDDDDEHDGVVQATFGMVILQIMVLDAVFSIDSVITAVGMTDNFAVMVAAVSTAIAVMILAAGPVSSFIERHPTTKMLALSFLLLIGMSLVADGLGMHIPRAYLYFAIAFSLGVEILNLLYVRGQRQKGQARQRMGRGRRKAKE